MPKAYGQLFKTLPSPAIWASHDAPPSTAKNWVPKKSRQTRLPTSMVVVTVLVLVIVVGRVLVAEEVPVVLADVEPVVVSEVVLVEVSDVAAVVNRVDEPDVVADDVIDVEGVVAMVVDLDVDAVEVAVLDIDVVAVVLNSGHPSKSVPELRIATAALRAATVVVQLLASNRNVSNKHSMVVAWPKTRSASLATAADAFSHGSGPASVRCTRYRPSAGAQPSRSPTLQSRQIPFSTSTWYWHVVASADEKNIEPCGSEHSRPFGLFSGAVAVVVAVVVTGVGDSCTLAQSWKDPPS